MRETGSVEETYFFKRTPRAHLSQISSPSDTPYPSLTLVIKISALSKHSPAKRNKPNTSGWQTLFPAQPELVAEPGWQYPHNVCGGGLARELRRNGKDKLVVCTIKCTRIPQLASSPAPSSVHRRTTRTSGPKRPYLPDFFGLSLLFGVFIKK